MRTDQALLDRMIELYRSGMTIRDIGKTVNRDYSWVSKRIKKTGEPGRRIVYKHRVVEMRLQGKSKQEIVSATGASLATVTKICRVTGL